MNRKLLILLLAGVIVSQVFLWWIKPEASVPQTAGPPRSGYSLHDFRLQVMDPEGRIQFTIQSPRLQKRNADASLFIDQPKLRMVTQDGRAWLMQAQRGWVQNDASLLKLSGKVVLNQPDTQTRITTSDITAWPEQERLATSEATAIRQPGRILSGTGMKADLTTHTLELLADVHGTLQPDTPH